jgi:tRNA threonylcarbamoyladenosine biosynthesis protein TsaE
MNSEPILSHSELDTFTAGKNLSSRLKPGAVICLEGSLGSGKSVFIRGVLSALGINEPVPSPTFTLVNEYQGNLPVYHFDLYRINDPYELYEIGFEELVYGQGVSVIEWASRAEDLIPDQAIRVLIEITGENDRMIRIQS